MKNTVTVKTVQTVTVKSVENTEDIWEEMPKLILQKKIVKNKITNSRIRRLTDIVVERGKPFTTTLEDQENVSELAGKFKMSEASVVIVSQEIAKGFWPAVYPTKPLKDRYYWVALKYIKESYSDSVSRGK